jgi:hypothetical protein
MLSSKQYSIACLACLLVLFATKPHANDYDFRILKNETELVSPIKFEQAQYVNKQTDPSFSNKLFNPISLAFEFNAGIYAQEYNFDFNTSLTPRMLDANGSIYFPVLTLNHFPKAEQAPFMSAVRGPYFQSNGQYHSLVNAFVLNRQFFDSEFGNTKTSDNKHVEAQLLDLSIANAISHSAIASTCYAANQTRNQSPIAGKILTTIAKARALDIYKGKKGLDSPIDKLADVTLAIADMSNNVRHKIHADQLASYWLGKADLTQSMLHTRLSDTGDIDYTDALNFLSPLELYLLSTILPQRFYAINGNTNMLTAMDIASLCNTVNTPNHVVTYLSNVFRTFEQQYPSVRDDNLFRHRDLITAARSIRINLPHFFAQVKGKDVSDLDDTVLAPNEWEKALFQKNDGCPTVDLDHYRALKDAYTTIPPFGVSCIKLVWSHNKPTPLNISIRLKEQGEQPLEKLKSIVVYQDLKFKTGFISQETSTNTTSQNGTSYNAVLSVDTLSENQSSQLLRTPINQSYLYFHNIAENIVDTQPIDILVDITQPEIASTITAFDMKQGQNWRTKPTKIVAPTLPNPLYINANLHIDNPSEVSKPKLRLSFMYAPDMEEMTQSLQQVAVDSLSSFSFAGGFGIENETFTQQRSKNVQQLIEKMTSFSRQYAEKSPNNLLEVAITADAVEPGYTGELQNVEIKVSWTDNNGIAGTALSLGPEDLNSHPQAVEYLNNGQLNITRFSPDVFVANFSGILTDEPIHPPMRQKQAHEDRVVTGQANGTVIVTSLSKMEFGERKVDKVNLTQNLLSGIGRLSLGDIDTDQYKPAGDNSLNNKSNSQSGIQAFTPTQATPYCDCSCSQYWNASPAIECIKQCHQEYLYCRVNQPTYTNRVSQYAEEIDFFWEQMGITTPELQTKSKENLVRMTPKQFKLWLDALKLMGYKKRPN